MLLKCAMSIAWDVQLKATLSQGSVTRGVLGTALLPGSESVMPRKSPLGASQPLIPCGDSLERCPYASNISRGSSGGDWQVVNRAPFIGDGG